MKVTKERTKTGIVKRESESERGKGREEERGREREKGKESERTEADIR